ncbi:transposable element Tcb2 transposase [Trichonephila clavipes]|nr:transposable element Tcb2 transposase [Trichonephila clavipes]
MPNEDRYLVLTARRHRNMKATLLQQHLRYATGTTVSTQTVRNRLHGVGLYARRPMVCVRLTSRHRRDRREWATEHVNWRKNEWSNVVFSDESRFSVHPDNRRIFIWRDRDSRNNPAFVHESVRFGGGGVLVYGGISIDGRIDFYIFRDGPLTVRREYVWDALGRRVAFRQPPPQTLQELERALLEEWNRIPQIVINSLIDSMPQGMGIMITHIVTKPVFDDDDGLNIWGNSTRTLTVPDSYNIKLSFFLIGMSFIIGLVSGFILHWLYMNILKYFLTYLEENQSMSDGVINLSFIDNDSRPIRDPPPDYASVMSGERSGDTPRLDRGMFSFLKQVFRRSSDESEDGIIEGEAPPSYWSVVESLERGLNN